MEATATPSTSPAEPSFDVEASARKDDRRNKQYYREVAVRLIHPLSAASFDPRSVARAAYEAVTDGGERVLRKVYVTELPHERRAAGIRWLDSPRGDVWVNHRRGSEGERHYTWAFRIWTEKPSEIPHEQDAVLWAQTYFVPELERGIEGAAAEKREEERRERAVRQANHVGEWAAKRTLERAKAATRYEQRLAALNAEMDAELKVQARTLLADGHFDKAVERHAADVAAGRAKDALEPEAVAYAREHFHKRTAGWNQPFSGGVRWFEGNVFPPEDGETK